MNCRSALALFYLRPVPGFRSLYPCGEEPPCGKPGLTPDFKKEAIARNLH